MRARGGGKLRLSWFKAEKVGGVSWLREAYQLHAQTKKILAVVELLLSTKTESFLGEKEG